MVEDGQFVEAGTEVVKDIFLPEQRCGRGNPERTTFCGKS
jgi:hypothetical protein